VFDDIHKSLRGGASRKAAAAIANAINR